MQMNVKNYFKSGEAYVWLNAGAVTVCLLMIVGILSLIAVRGMSHFWPADVMQATYSVDGTSQTIIGEIYDEKTDLVSRLTEAGMTVPAHLKPTDSIDRWSIKQGNKDVSGQDFVWVTVPFLSKISYPTDIVKLERLEYGNFYGRLSHVTVNGKTITGAAAIDALDAAVSRSNALHAQVRDLEKGRIGSINYALEQLRLDARKLQLQHQLTAKAQARLDQQQQQLEKSFAVEQAKLETLALDLNRDSAVFQTADGTEKTLSVSQVLHLSQPNAMSGMAKLGMYFANIWNFLSEDPREANTEGGVFPAIFGTILMVFMMTIIVTPLGVVAAVYLREYAKQGLFTQIIRIAVNNLAGVPSIVYGVFGLGFFVYVVGGTIDQVFFPESAPQPVFGTPGLLWASITLALLTLPVVIVATEEGLSRIPRSLKEGSLALGSTKAETLWRVVLPMAAPSIMTGMILAIARAAGEVAPLMLVGVVKLAPALPLDMNAPFLHLDRKFMHLGFHIYDVGFQSPNVEAARPLVYATALLLVLVVATLNLSAISLRNRLREKYKALEH
jgi:phosphate transport system permease protein